MKFLAILLITCSVALGVSNNWTNYPSVNAPHGTDTFMVATTGTNNQILAADVSAYINSGSNASVFPSGTVLAADGDSQTSGAFGTTTSWFYQLGQMQSYTNCQYYNAAVNGAKMTDLTNHYASTVHLRSPAVTGTNGVLLLFAGYNDSLTDFATFAAQYTWYVTNALADGWTMGLFTLTGGNWGGVDRGIPGGQGTNGARMNQFILSFTAPVYRINLAYQFPASGTNGDYPSWYNDAIHTTVLGAQMMAKYVDSCLRNGKNSGGFNYAPFTRSDNLGFVITWPDNAQFLGYWATNALQNFVNYQQATNPMVWWPHHAETEGGFAIVNSNSFPYMLLSAPNSTTWTATNKLGW